MSESQDSLYESLGATRTGMAKPAAPTSISLIHGHGLLPRKSLLRNMKSYWQIEIYRKIDVTVRPGVTKTKTISCKITDF